MITDGKKWHYLAVKNLSLLLRGITSKHEGDFYCLNFFYSFRTKNQLKKHKVEIAKWKCLKKITNIFKYNH